MSDAEKRVRLAEALRANLRKRKAQARELGASASEELPHPNPFPEGKGLERD